MSRMILGRKIGMTQVFEADGRRIPVTIVQVGPMVVVRKKSELGRDGYAAVVVGYEDAHKQEKDGDVRWRGLSKAQVGVYTAAGIDVPKRYMREFTVEEAELDRYEVGQVLDHTMFEAGIKVDVTAISRGRGFSGVMKRHNFSGFKASHGVHESYRGGGSIGASAYPSRVFPGTKMPGRYGGVITTTQNVRLVRIDADDSLYLLRGAVPGAKGGLVTISPATKKRR